MPDRAGWPLSGAARLPVLLLLFSLVFLAAGFFLGAGTPSLIFFASAGAVGLLAGISAFRIRRAEVRSDRGATRGGGFLVEHDPAPCFLTGADGRVTTQNAACRARFGDRIGQPMAKALSNLLVNAPAVVFRQETALSQGDHARETVFTRSGHVRLTVHKAPNGAIWRIEEVVAPAARQGDGIALPMMVASQNGTILSMNDAMRNMLGQRARSLAAVFGGHPVVSGSRMELDGVDGPVPATIVEAISSDGRREIYAIPGDGLRHVAASPGDVFNALPVATLIINAAGEVVSSNPVAHALLGIEPDEENLPLSALVEGPGRVVRDWLRDILEDRVPNRSEVVRALRGGEARSVKIALGRVHQDGEPRLLAVLQDATDLQSLQQQFAQSQKMQAIGELAGGVAHDFNNLLTAITGHCDLLLLRHDQGDQDFGDLVQIQQNANRAASLVGQLLAFSRKQTMRPELLDLRDTMADLTHLLNRLVGERVTLQLSQDPTLQPIRADRRLMDQVLMNLVVNARDAMPEGGSIRITTRMVRLDEPLERSNARVPDGTYVVIEVADKGVGIPEDRIGRIFEPFYTTKQVGEGTGLGLSMAYGIVKQSGGYIFAESTVGEGTVFSIFFPAHDWPAEPLEPVDATDPRPSGQTREGTGAILLVEDEAPVRAFASRALRLKGFSVFEAENGEQALDILEDDELEIDVFVTDMIMPGKGGPDWVREAMVSRPNVGVVFMSGYAEDAYGKFADDIPDAVFLAKPFSLADLSEIVRQQLPD